MSLSWRIYWLVSSHALSVLLGELVGYSKLIEWTGFTSVTYELLTLKDELTLWSIKWREAIRGVCCKNKFRNHWASLKEIY